MKQSITRDEAESIALQALTLLAQSPTLLGEFLAETGLGPQDLKLRLKDELFLAGVLDFYLGRPPLVLEFAQQTAVDPRDLLYARVHFPGADPASWVLT